MLKAEGFEGALDEFNQARLDFSADNYKGAILNACKSMESVLKTLLGIEQGSAGHLIDGLTNSDFFVDVPESVSKSFGDSVLKSLPFLRNRLAGHGQGEQAQDAPRKYAQLAVNLAASFNYFLVQGGLGLDKEMPDNTELEDTDLMDDNDIPF